MSQSHAMINDLLRWAQDTNPSVLHENVEIYDDPTTGLSFRALKDIPSSSTVVRCPYAISLSYLNAIEAGPYFQCHGSSDLPKDFAPPHVIGHFFLMQQYLLGPNSFWYSYIRLLPQPDEPHRLGIPIWWPEDDQKFLIGTNAEPPLKQRKELWLQEYAEGIKALSNGAHKVLGIHKYTYELYQWVATIFGTRSFRASLTIPEGLISEDEEVRAHTANDRFSVLLPVVDMGNHNGINSLEWRRNASTFSLLSRSSLTQGSQIYNFYGDKTNSELLVGYGFMLSDVGKDTVNLKLKPSSEALALRRSMKCYAQDSRDLAESDDEFMFHVRNVPGFYEDEDLDVRPKEYRLFSKGLVDTVACMLANDRERHFFEHNPDHCLESYCDIFDGRQMSRLALHVLCVLYGKLEHDRTRIVEHGTDLGNLRNHNQRLALTYRTRQLSVLHRALSMIESRFDAIILAQSNGLNPVNFPKHSPSSVLTLLTLPRAYALLESYCPSVSQQIETLISNDQQEPLPLDWTALISEGWDFAYWVIWFYTIYLLSIGDRCKFTASFAALAAWMDTMESESRHESTLLPAISKAANVTFNEREKDINAYAEDPSEISTITNMITSINNLLEFDTPDVRSLLGREGGLKTTLAMAGRVGREETITIPWAGENVGKMLCVWRERSL